MTLMFRIIEFEGKAFDKYVKVSRPTPIVGAQCMASRIS